MKKVKLGIIGCGWIAQYAYVPVLREIKNAIVLSVFDIDSSRAQQVCRVFSSAKAYEDMNSFFKSGVEAVIIATPNFSHVEYTLNALEKGISVLCEKPIAFLEKEIWEIGNMAKRHNALYVPGMVNRWRKDVQQMQSLLRSNKIGKVTDVSAGWIRKQGVPRPGTWFTNKELSGGGVLVDLGSHMLDICTMIMEGREPEYYQLISAPLTSEAIKDVGAARWFKRNDPEELELNVESTAIVQITYRDGAKLRCNLSWLSSIENDCTYFKICGDKGEIELKTLFGFSTERYWNEDTLTVKVEGITETYHYDKKENGSMSAFKEMISNFTNLVQGRLTETGGILEACRLVSCIEQLYMSDIVDAVKATELLTAEIHSMR